MNGARPNTFIVGAPKCGTTAWAHWLAGHPDVFVPALKEPHHFSTDFPGFSFARARPAYEALFAGAEAKIRVDASVQYFYSAAAAQNIAAYAPEARIVVFVRRQETFLPSYHNQLVENLDETETDFAAAWRLALAGARRPPATCREPRFLDYPEVGRFAPQLTRYLDAFAPSQILLMAYEAWTADPPAAWAVLLDFLGLQHQERAGFAAVNAARHHRSGWVARLTRRPPGAVLGTARVARRLAGAERLGLAARLARLNSAAGYRARPDASLAAELAAYFAADNARLTALAARCRGLAPGRGA